LKRRLKEKRDKEERQREEQEIATGEQLQQVE
jgi:hypothetical protein